jgi:hypothetical protein
LFREEEYRVKRDCPESYRMEKEILLLVVLSTSNWREDS